MPLKLYNTLTRKKELFKPQKPGRVLMYTCGPTVYDYAHIGNLSAYIMADLLRRYLEYKSYKVKHIKNITDVGHLTEEEGHDKIEKKAKKEKKDPHAIAKFFEKAFYQDEKKLNIKPADKFPRATEHIIEMIKLIEVLLKKDYAYKTKSGVYFSIAKFENYGKLSGNPPDNLLSGARIGIREEKKDPRDFVLWIFDPKHLMQWPSPFGRGYPGWHIECSAMAQKYLGVPIDIHTGGEDNIFPHHECEIAQSESATDKKFVRFWLHKRHLMVDGKKMSKSLDNFYTLENLEKQGYPPLVLRFLVLSAHYRTKLNFTKNSIKQAKENLEKMYEFIKKLKAQNEKLKTKTQNPKLIKKLAINLKQKFEAAFDNDLNSPKAIAAIFEFMGKINPLLLKNGVNQKTAKEIYNLFEKLDRVLGLDLTNPLQIKLSKEKGGGILKLIKQREQARKDKNFAQADKIRAKLQKMNVEIHDTTKGTEWKIKS
jgi:cysteinyl-tRNA synthetase